MIEITKEIQEIFYVNSVEIYYREKDKKWICKGDGGTICRCLRATRGKKLTVDGYTYLMEDVTKQLYQLPKIKFAFERLEK